MRSDLVCVVVVPPLVRCRLRISLRRVFPRLLAAERRDVEVVPRPTHLLVTPSVNEVGAVGPITFTNERIGPVPLVDVEVLVEIVGDRVPGDMVPSVALLQALNVDLRRAGGPSQRRASRMQVARVRDLVGTKGAPDAGPLGVRAPSA